jgi:hypothetical protein
MSRKSRREIEHELGDLKRQHDPEQSPALVVIDFEESGPVTVKDGETTRELTREEFREEYGHPVEDCDVTVDFGDTQT